MSFFISEAQAKTAGATQPGGGLDLVIMLVAFGLIFYFMIYRPQAKRMKDHKNLMSALAKYGRKVVWLGASAKLLTTKRLSSLP